MPRVGAGAGAGTADHSGRVRQIANASDREDQRDDADTQQPRRLALPLEKRLVFERDFRRADFPRGVTLAAARLPR